MIGCMTHLRDARVVASVILALLPAAVSSCQSATDVSADSFQSLGLERTIQSSVINLRKARERMGRVQPEETERADLLRDPLLRVYPEAFDAATRLLRAARDLYLTMDGPPPEEGREDETRYAGVSKAEFVRLVEEMLALCSDIHMSLDSRDSSNDSFRGPGSYVIEDPERALADGWKLLGRLQDDAVENLQLPPSERTALRARRARTQRIVDTIDLSLLECERGLLVVRAIQFTRDPANSVDGDARRQADRCLWLFGLLSHALRTNPR